MLEGRSKDGVTDCTSGNSLKVAAISGVSGCSGWETPNGSKASASSGKVGEINTFSRPSASKLRLTSSCTPTPNETIATSVTMPISTPAAVRILRTGRRRRLSQAVRTRSRKDRPPFKASSGCERIIERPAFLAGAPSVASIFSTPPSRRYTIRSA